MTHSKRNKALSLKVAKLLCMLGSRWMPISMAPISRSVLCPKCQHRANLIKTADSRFVFACTNIAKKTGAGESGFACTWQSRIMTLLEAEALVMGDSDAD